MEITLSSAEQIFNILLSIFSMQILQRIKLTDNHIFILRSVYVITQLLQLGLLYEIKRRIKKRDDKRTFLINTDGNNSTDQREMTYSEYDLDEASKLLRSTLFQIPIVLFLHLKMGLPQPIMMQVINFFKNLFIQALFNAYIWNERFYKISRPFEESILIKTGESEEEAEEREKKTEKKVEKKVVDVSDEKEEEEKEFVRKTERIVEEESSEEEVNESNKKEEE